MVNLRGADRRNAENLSDFVETTGKQLLLTPTRARNTRPRGIAMFGFAGLISVIIGGGLAYIAERYPARVDLLQTVGGLLLIAGFGLVGWSWPTVV
jgi:hypothetical protein